MYLFLLLNLVYSDSIVTPVVNGLQGMRARRLEVNSAEKETIVTGTGDRKGAKKV